MRTRGWVGLWVFVIVGFGCESAPASPSGTASATSSAAPATSSSTARSAAPTSTAATADEAAVKKVFLDYRAAIGEKNGRAAADASSARTLEYYESVRKKALTLPEKELRATPTADRFMIVLIRASVDAAALRKMDGRSLFEHAVNEGMVGKNTQSLEPDAIEIEGDTAYLGMRAGGDTLPPRKGFRVYREQGSWKIDVLSVMGTVGASMDQMLAKVDPDIDTAMVKIAEQLTGKSLAKTIWTPPDAAPVAR